MAWILPIIGAVFVTMALHDLFHTLFHPSEHGNISEYLSLRLWRMLRHFEPEHLNLAGPLNLLTVILYWGVSVVVGFACIYRPFLPGHFVFNPGLDAHSFNSFLSAINLSMASLITVTLGVQTNSAWLQLATSAEAVLGFVILTASISWILSIYPVIEHRRSLAHEVSLLHFAEERGIRHIEQLKTAELQSLLLGFATQLTTIRTELSQFPITYFFQERDDKSALAPSLYYLAAIAEDVVSTRDDVKMSAAVMGGAIDDLIELIEKKYLKKAHAHRWGALDALLRDHRREPLRRPSSARVASGQREFTF
jgi:hypothetical protein